MASRKIALEEIDVSEIECRHEEVTVHGVVTERSPAKVSRKKDQVKYFSGKLSDGKTVTVVAFDPALCVNLEKLCVDGSTVALIKCEVKEIPMEYYAGKSGEFEIIASSRSRAEKSPQKKFQLLTDLKTIDPECESVPAIQLKDLDDVAVNQYVTASIKVVGVEDQASDRDE